MNALEHILINQCEWAYDRGETRCEPRNLQDAIPAKIHLPGLLTVGVSA